MSVKYSFEIWAWKHTANLKLPFAFSPHVTTYQIFDHVSVITIFSSSAYHTTTTFYIPLTNIIIFTKWNNCFSPNKTIEGSGSSSRQWTVIRRPGLCSLLKSWTLSEPVCLPLKGGMIFKSFWTPLIIHLWPHHPKLAVNSFQIFLMLFYPSLVLLLAV